MRTKDPILPYGEQPKSGSNSSVLAIMYRALLSAANINLSMFDQKLKEYIQHTFRDSTNNKDRTSIRAGLYKELMRPTMSFKVFMKGLRVIKVLRVQMSITVFTNLNKGITVSQMFDLGEEHSTDIDADADLFEDDEDDL